MTHGTERHGLEKYFILGKGRKVVPVTGEILPSAWVKDAAQRCKDHTPKRGRDYCKAPPAYKAPPFQKGYDKDNGDIMSPPHQSPRRIFCRLFEEGPDHNPAGLIDLGLAMEVETQLTANVAGDSDIPGGYTYLGQFIDHDISATPGSVELTTTGTVDPEDIPNGRSPTLDLDCLYGEGPDDTPELYEADKVHLKVGETSETLVGEPGGPIPGGGAHDLPRRADKTAIIGDGRNDENLAVAQTHLAFIKFHNKKVDEIAAAENISGKKLFKRAREETTLHYQAIVLTDFLPRIIENGVLQDVLANKRKFYTQNLKGCMPVEFSVAAYRLGHSMVRPVYEWNSVFNSGPSGIPATFELLFEFSGVSGTRVPDGTDQFIGKPTLPSNWPVDWTRMYDFSAVPGITSHPSLNFTREIEANLATALRTLPEFQRDPKIREMPVEEQQIRFSLATRNLLRGRLLRLPSGQEAAAALGVPGLTNEEVASGPHRAIVEANGFHETTPLWYYILREAKVRHDGNRLGPVGSRILAEVFVGLVDHAKINVRKERPGLTYSMPELLAEVGDLNPVG
jgi:hypothetical protein